MILSMIGLVAGSFMNLFGEMESSTGASCVDRERGVRAVMGGACPTQHGHRSSLGDPRTERGLALGKCQTHVVHLHDQGDHAVHQDGDEDRDDEEHQQPGEERFVLDRDGCGSGPPVRAIMNFRVIIGESAGWV